MNNESQICFISSPHDSFFCGKVVEFKERYHKSPDEYHKALFYCLGINCDTRRNFENIYDWQTDCIKPECLKEGWQTRRKKSLPRILQMNIWHCIKRQMQRRKNGRKCIED